MSTQLRLLKIGYHDAFAYAELQRIHQVVALVPVYCITCSHMATRQFKGTTSLISSSGGVQMLCSHMATKHLKGSQTCQQA